MENMNVTDPITLEGEVVGLWSNQFEGPSIEMKKAQIFMDGFWRDRHRGYSRFSGGREEHELPSGREIFNIRQTTLVSIEELEQIRSNLDIQDIFPQDLEANIALKGIPKFSKLPAGTKLFFPKFAALYITYYNRPCFVPGQNIENRLGKEFKGIRSKFAGAALELRGQCAITYAPGKIYIGDKVKVVVPVQELYLNN